MIQLNNILGNNTASKVSRSYKMFLFLKIVYIILFIHTVVIAQWKTACLHGSCLKILTRPNDGCVRSHIRMMIPTTVSPLWCSASEFYGTCSHLISGSYHLKQCVHMSNEPPTAHQTKLLFCNKGRLLCSAQFSQPSLFYASNYAGFTQKYVLLIKCYLQNSPMYVYSEIKTSVSMMFISSIHRTAALGPGI